MTRPRLLERIGVPQVIGATLLLFYLLQCAWFITQVAMTPAEGGYLEAGLLQLDDLATASTPDRSPLVPVLAALGTKLVGGERNFAEINRYRWLMRLPFLVAGILLGASLWYVARRLYGNTGGYVALTLYSFSPMTIIRASQAQPEILAAWGAFGLVFTSIAVAHTLYAPREVVLWNWKRILLMGLSIAVCLASQFSLWLLLVLSLGFMLWVGHVRRRSALVIFATAAGTGAVLLWAFYGFRPAAFAGALSGANWIEFVPAEFVSRTSYALLGVFFRENGVGPLVLLLLSLATFAVWPRTRYFGTVAPLLSAAILLLCAVGMPHYAGFTFVFVSLPFLLLFAAGIAADLLESRFRPAALALVGGIVVANAVVNIYLLLQLAPREAP